MTVKGMFVTFDSEKSLHECDLSEHSFYKIGAKVKRWFAPSNVRDLKKACQWAKRNNIPICIVGGTTNALFSDEDPGFLFLSLEKLKRLEQIDPVRVKAEAGVKNDDLVKLCKSIEKDLSWMYRLPGTIGGSARMNARAFGSEFSDIVESVKVLDESLETRVFTSKEFFLGYKNTLAIQHPYIVLDVIFYLDKKTSEGLIYEEMCRIENERDSRKHFEAPCCGSVFKNNYSLGISSGKIFDELGFKGKLEGGAQVSPFHGNFILNRGKAKALDVLKLALEMRTAALIEKKAELELELQPIGVFPRKIIEDLSLPYIEKDDDYVYCGAWIYSSSE